MYYRVIIDNFQHPHNPNRILQKGTIIDLFHLNGDPLTVGDAASLEKVTRRENGEEGNILEQVIHQEISNKLPELLNDHTGLSAIMASVTATNTTIGEEEVELEIEVMNNAAEKAFNVKVFFDLGDLLITDMTQSGKIDDTMFCWGTEVLPVGGKMNIKIKATSLSATEQDVTKTLTVEGFNISPVITTIDLHLNKRVLPPEETVTE